MGAPQVRAYQARVSLLRLLVQSGIFSSVPGATGEDGGEGKAQECVRAIFCPLDYARPSKYRPPCAQELLEAAGVPVPERRREPEAGGSASGTDEAESWEQTLSLVWDALQHEHASGSAGTCPSTSLVLPSIGASVEWVQQHAEAMAMASATSGEKGSEAQLQVPVRALATGSLYLVGGVLNAVFNVLAGAFG